MGSSKRVLSTDELKSRKITRRSFVARFDIKEGETFTDENLKQTRPGTGIHPKYKNQIMGRKAKHNIQKENVIQWEDIV
jgi:sialic acid synthase SpsE